MSDRYILDANGQPVVEPNLETWARWFETQFDARRVALTEIGEYRVSTVFLGIDHAFHGGPPVLWETMVFGPEPWADRCWRYHLRDAALAQHDQIVEHIRHHDSPDVLDDATGEEGDIDNGERRR